MVTNGNFAACAILARATRCNHWEMGKEVVDFGEALDTCVTAAIGAEIAERQVVLYVGSAQLLARQRCLGSFSSDVRFRLRLLSETLWFHGDALFRGVWLRR